MGTIDTNCVHTTHDELYVPNCLKQSEQGDFQTAFHVGSATDLWRARASQTMEQNNDNNRIFCSWRESVAGQTYGMHSGQSRDMIGRR